MLVLLDVLAGEVLTPSMPALRRLCRARLANTFRRLNMPARSREMYALAGPMPPSEEELALYEEEVVQREQTYSRSSSGAGNAGVGSGHAIFQRKLERLQVHDMWIRLARVTMEEQNNVGHALRLLVESERYAKAFDDGHALLAIAELRARIALRKGDTEQAASDLAPCLAAGPNTPVVDVHVATERTLLQSRILTLQRNQHAAKKLIRKFQTQLQNISSFAASCSQERGAKARAGFAADLDIHAAGARLSVALADLLCEEVVGLKSRDSPWKDEWAKCRSTYQESVETMERTDDVRALPAACQAWAQAILRVEGEDGSDEVTSELSPLVLQISFRRYSSPPLRHPMRSCTRRCLHLLLSARP